ncbi:MAG: LuxR family transcriptional regulator [Alphaproteobacteria bacterium]|nr:LuxR family transcriptional regulator [Alphaproteobacteria bacterium]
MIILDFIEKSNRCLSRDELIQLFENTLLSFGVDRFVYSLARGSFTANNKTHHGLVRSYPEEWMKHYTSNRYIDSDPTFRYALKKKGPFTWHSLQEIIPLSKKEKTVMYEAEEAGLKNGITLSLHGPYGEVIGFGLASREKHQELSKDQLSILYAIANQFHLVYSSFEEAVDEPAISLSDRQREILQWAAVGKSRALIAEIMDISEDTVDDHFRHIFRKLGCNDRTLAVLKAIQLGLIRV